jgi:hypothetical protein
MEPKRPGMARLHVAARPGAQTRGVQCQEQTQQRQRRHVKQCAQGNDYSAPCLSTQLDMGNISETSLFMAAK